jgi:hypothetical protein
MREADRDLELAQLRRLTSSACAAANREVWRQAMGRRTRAVARIVARLPKLVPGVTTYRVKENGGWTIRVGDGDGSTVVMIVETRTPARTLQDLAQPIAVRVRLPHLVDMMQLGSLEAEGVVKLTVAAAP